MPSPARRRRPRDVPLLFASRALRLFAYGLLSVVLVLHLAAAGLDDREIGLLLSLTLGGDAAISLWLTTRADRSGRRRTLAAGALLVVVAGALLATTTSFPLLLLATTVGIVSPAGNEVGPFLAVEQAALAQLVPAARRTSTLAWYTLAGSLATALGALAGGAGAQALRGAGWAPLASYRAVAAGYAVAGAALLAVAVALSPAVEAPAPRVASARPWLGLHRSRPVVLRLSALFAVDSFAGGFVVQSLVASWFVRRFGAGEAAVGAVFFGANVLAGASALSAARIARRIGLVNTMVVTHLPSNVLLFAVPLMPTMGTAAAALLARYSISQMDVPTRQSYTMAVVDPDERSAAAGVTGIARTVGASLAPVVAGPLYGAAATAGIPFFIAGALKIAYDLALWRSFRRLAPPEEREATRPPS